ncbi:MAG: ABC transporter permease [Chloroflexi bacterium]|nr:ABC transporter permease [Chloroflexota bacterium]
MATNEAIGRLGGMELTLRPRRHWARRLLGVIRQNPLGFIGLLIILGLAAVAAFAPFIAPYDVGDFRSGTPREDPSWSHLFGTDQLGRDVFSRVVFGARISMTVAFFAVILGTGIAMVLGIVSGYLGGMVDNGIQRGVDTVIAFPQLLLLLILAQVLGPSMETVILAVGLGVIAPITRIVRGAVLSERNNQYVEAARALGASTPRILFVHIAPNMAALAIIIASTLFGVAILAEASLSFLGLGIPIPNPSWGTDVSLARTARPLHIWWALFPGLAITVTVLGFNLLGDALRDIFDPRLRGRL